MFKQFQVNMYPLSRILTLSIQINADVIAKKIDSKKKYSPHFLTGYVIISGPGKSVHSSLSGGSAEGPTAGILFLSTLPESKIRTRLPAFIQYNNVTSFEKGMGISRDI